MSRPRAALAGAAAALEPIEQRIFRNDHSDVTVLGKFAQATASRALFSAVLGRPSV